MGVILPRMSAPRRKGNISTPFAQRFSTRVDAKKNGVGQMQGNALGGQQCNSITGENRRRPMRPTPGILPASLFHRVSPASDTMIR
jgi:hypothetical protein